MKFLTQYDFEIRTRREMADREHADMSDQSTKNANDGEKDTGDDEMEVLEDEIAEERRAAREGMEESFTYMVGTYAIRPFLRKLDDFAVQLEERRFEEAKRRWDERLDEIGEWRMGVKVRGVMKKAETEFRALGRRLTSKVRGLWKKMKWGKRELCFGEIKYGSEGNGSLANRENGCRTGAVRRDQMREGLLWYYGDTGVLAFRAREGMIQIVRDDEVEGMTGEVCFALAYSFGLKADWVNSSKIWRKSRDREGNALSA